MAESLIKRFYDEVVTDGNLDLIDELTADGFVDHEEGVPGQPSGKEGVKFFVTTLRSAFPDVKVNVAITLAENDLEAALGVVTGTHRGEFMGVPASDKSVEFEIADIIRVEDGKAAEHWGLTDTMGLMQQIGALPE